MNEIFCFVLKAGHRLCSATVLTHGPGLLELKAKWRHAAGGFMVPVRNIEEAHAYVKHHEES